MLCLLAMTEMVTAPAAMERNIRMSWLVLHTRKLSLSSALIIPGRETIAMVAPLVRVQLCLNGNFCTGDMHGQTKSGEEAIGYYNRMGCNCDG